MIRPKLLENDQKNKIFHSIIEKIKIEGKNKKYDCLIGLSGGVDSSYLVYLAWIHNLRTIVVHFDNSWDSELAVKNIENIITITGFDYYNYVVNWEEFKSLQLSYLKASVVDIEVPTDLAIGSLIPKMAIKFDVKNILSGMNAETESTMGLNWLYEYKMDVSNLRAIHNKYGSRPLKTYPYYSYFDQFVIFSIKKVNTTLILNYTDSNYDNIKGILNKNFGWKDYGLKHGESIFTKFYQLYILPKKFGIDKRRAHLSDLINSKQIKRSLALNKLDAPFYDDLLEEKSQYDYVINKLGLSANEFEAIMELPIKSHYDFPYMLPHGNFIIRWFLNTVYSLYKIIKWIKLNIMRFMGATDER